MAAERIFIIGRPGTGKTTFAERVGAALGRPVHHLDELAREGGGRGRERTEAERGADVAAILESPRWIVEGVHLGWTQPLLQAADAVVWLDHVAWQRSSGRIVRRFLRQALAEARRRRGRERFLRLGDYARRLRELAVSVPETRTYSSAELEFALGDLPGELIRCRTAAEVEGALARLTA